MANRWRNNGNSDRLFFGAPKSLQMVTAGMKLKDTCSLEEIYDKPRQHIKSRDIALLTKAHIVKAMVFPVVMYGCETWTIKKAECRRTDGFELWCWRRLLRVPWTARRRNKSILKEIIGRTEYSLEGMMLKLQYSAMSIGKDPDAGKDWRPEEKRMTQDEIVEWHHRLDGHEFM